MNVAFYDLSVGQLCEHTVADRATPDDVRDLVCMVQLEALQKGDRMDGLFLVAWDGKRGGYTSVFVLDEGDHCKLSEALLDSIKDKAFQLSAQK